MRSSVLTICLAGLLLTSCAISISTPTPPNPTPHFVTATLPPTQTPFQRPTTPSPTVPPTNAGGSASCKDKAILIQDVTIADGTNVPRGSKFTKTWQFKNTGTCTWTGYTIAFVSGDRLDAPDTSPVPQTASQKPVNVSVDLVAPTSDGVYTGYFELHNASGEPLDIGIFKNFWVKITVGNVILPTQAPVGTPTSGTPVSKPKGPASCKYVGSPSYPGEIADLINSARTQAGLPKLTINAQLAAAAQGHSIDMACFSLLSHTGSNGSNIHDRILAAGYAPSNWLEIIYAGGYPRDAFDWWMNSQVHHDAILSPNVAEMGVGYAYVSDSAYGGYYTVDFGSR